MTLEIRRALKSDYSQLAFLMNIKDALTNKNAQHMFESAVDKSGHSVLLGFIDGELAAVLSISIISGIGNEYPFAVISGARIKKEYEKIGLERAMLCKAEYIAANNGCRKITAVH